MNRNEPAEWPLYDTLAAAFIRGRLAQGDEIPLSATLVQTPVEDLSGQQLASIHRAGRGAGLKLNKFKRTMGLARVHRVLGVLRSIMPTDLLDVGSGRGAFLWPLLDTFPQMRVTAIDHHPQRAKDLQAVEIGGIIRLKSHRMDVTELVFSDDDFEVVTVLEVLEHIPNFRLAIREAVRVARRFVIASVPSKPDDNPEHIHLLPREHLHEAFTQAGCRQIKFDSVLNHLIVIAAIG